MTESVIDFPKNSLCPDIWEYEEQWEKGGNCLGYKFHLTDIARLKIEKLAKRLMEWMNIDSYAVHITGSITSNTYTKSSDIDVHFLKCDSDGNILKLDQTEQKQLTEILRAEYEENYKDECISDCSIAGHPIEVYFQGNEFQDYMSIGCYDLYNRKWIVGPEITDIDPYNTYYKEIKRRSNFLVRDIRNTILDVYEHAVICQKHINNDKTNSSTFNELIKELFDQLNAAGNLFKSVHDSRKAYSEPTNIDDALKMRSSKYWKIADATFKLLDKFGYLAILKQFGALLDIITEHTISEYIDIVCSQIISITKQYIGNPEKLADSEK